MCGFAGLVHFDDQPVEPSRLERMLKAVAHRGPDGQDIALHPRCGLAHARLGIIDIPMGQQPMRVDDQRGRITVVANGVIYNHHELRHKLEARGHRFQTHHSDIEVLLHGYREWGTDLPMRLNGMFAFGLWDQSENQLLLCRDPLGQKPLYFRREKNSFSFASLVSALTVHDRPAIDQRALRTFLELGYCFDQTLMTGIEQLPAGHWMTVDRQGEQTLHRYWSPPPVSRSRDALGNVEATREMLDLSVRHRLEADVPLGCFLSGGIDSSIVAAIAQKHLRKRGQPPLKTFSVAMPDLDYDESRYARMVAQHVGSQHLELVAHPSQDVFGDLELLMRSCGEPTADSSILPTCWLSRITRQHVKVALSGDGGDELFAGYDRYRAMRWITRCRSTLRCIPRSLVKARPGQPWAMRTRLRRLLDAAAPLDPPRQYHQMVMLFSDAQIRRLAPELVQTNEDVMAQWLVDEDPVAAAMRWDMENYLPFNLLRKIDRAAMLSALEVRSPFLDKQVCALACHLPARAHMMHNRPKALLRQAAAPFLPQEIIHRKKRGFALPIGRWFAGPLAGRLRDVLSSAPLDAAGIEKNVALRLAEDHAAGRADHTHRLFALASLAVWLQCRLNHSILT